MARPAHDVGKPVPPILLPFRSSLPPSSPVYGPVLRKRLRSENSG
jgi:hypothetical protein